MLDSRFAVLNQLAVELKKLGLDVSVDPETVCIGRDQWDKYSRRILTMLSAAPAIRAGEKSFFIYASEQYDPNGNLCKYSIKLCDGKKQQLEAWELDTKRGQHKHFYVDNSKVPTHIAFVGTIDAIASEMLDRMRMAEPNSDGAGGC